MSPADRSVDVVVVGAGMAGLVAAVEAQQRGSDVLVLEKGTRAGGSMFLSAGIVYTYDSFERVREAVPHGDPALQKLVVERKDEDIEWLSSLGVALREPTGDVTFGSGKQLDPESFTQRMVDIVADGSGELWLDTPMTGLSQEDGAVRGVTAHVGAEATVAGSDGDPQTNGGDRQLSVAADSVVLATGGFQGDETLVEQFVTETPENVWLRANPWSTGDGLHAARAVGATTTGAMGSFYGHNLPAPPAEVPPSKLLDAKQAYGVMTVAVDESGERFADEAASPYEVALTQATARRAGGRAYYVVDRDLYESQFASRSVAESIRTAEALGGRVGTAASKRELETILFEWGVNGENAVETLESFNAAVDAGEGARLDPPRSDHQRPVDEPPFHVVEVQPGITFTMGGLAVTDEMAVLRRAGTSATLSHSPEDRWEGRVASIPGLYAAGVDVGDVMRRRYMGGLAVALVTGRVAGHNAASG